MSCIAKRQWEQVITSEGIICYEGKYTITKNRRYKEF